MGREMAFLDSRNIGPLCFWREIVVAVAALDAVLTYRRISLDMGRILSPSS